MFCFKAGVLLEELKAFHPEVYENQNWFGKANLMEFRFIDGYSLSALIMR
jgi:mannose-1-phosphate guanylyltransferase